MEFGLADKDPTVLSATAISVTMVQAGSRTSATTAKEYKRHYKKELRNIASQLLSTPVEALRLEAGIQSYNTQSKRLLSRSWEKARDSAAPIRMIKKCMKKTRMSGESCLVFPLTYTSKI